MSNEKDAKIISFVNMKGGVAKTTLAINIAKELSKKHRVLVIDMDPQFNATQSLLFYKVSIEENTHYKKDSDTEIDVASDRFLQASFNNDVKSSRFYSELSTKGCTAHAIFSDSSLVNEKTLDDFLIDICENLKLLPGDLELSNDISGDPFGKSEALDKFLFTYDIKRLFDYIIVDCSPTWSLLLLSSLSASDYYIIPSKIDTYSSLGIDSLESRIDKYIRDPYYIKKHNINPPKCLGVIFTLTNPDLVVEKNLKEELIDKYKETYKMNVFENDFPYVASVSSKFILIDEVRNDKRYKNIVTPIEKITSEIEDKI